MNIGDKVRVNNKNSCLYGYEGIVTKKSDSDGWYRVDFHSLNVYYYFRGCDLELIKEATMSAATMKSTASLQELSDAGMSLSELYDIMIHYAAMNRPILVKDLIKNYGVDPVWLREHGFGEPVKYEPKQDVMVKCGGVDYKGWYVKFDGTGNLHHKVYVIKFDATRWVTDKDIHPMQEPK